LRYQNTQRQLRIIRKELADLERHTGFDQPIQSQVRIALAAIEIAEELSAQRLHSQPPGPSA
jgi:hypothetical protein